MKFEIKHRLNGSVLFALECESLKICVEAAVKSKLTLRGAYLSGVDLMGAYLRGADLRDADLRGAYLRDADLRDADLMGAYLRGADLRDADLRGAYLRDADLRDADLRGADLRDADLRDADLMGVDLAAHIGQPDGWYAWTYLDTKEKEQRVQVGCRNYTIAEGREYWANKDNRREVLAALDFAEAIGKLRGWGNEE
jgi:hypothetical protein